MIGVGHRLYGSWQLGEDAEEELHKAGGGNSIVMIAVIQHVD
jgi:hypothetical protein